MRWDATTANAGFTSGEPWLPIGEHIAECNVSTQRQDECSILHLYRQLIALRRAEPTLLAGSYEPQPMNGDLLSYRRRYNDDVITVMLNFGGSSQAIALPAGGEVILSTYLDPWGARAGSDTSIRPDEGILIRSRA